MATAVTRPFANRAIHLRITPRPSNLGESREIMRLLSQFGEIEYFKSLKYDALAQPNKALVIYQEEKAAQDCLRGSPIRFRMGKVPAQQAATKQTSSMAYNPLSSFDPSSDGQIYQIVTSPSFRNFRDTINMGHYHGRFVIDSKMPGQPDLAGKVPTPGLSCVDWKAIDKPWRVIAGEKRKWGGQGSLAKMAGLPPPVATADAIDAETADNSTYRPFSEMAEEKKQEEAVQPSANDPLDSIIKGWGSMLPGGTAEASEVHRYSRKRS